MTFTSTAAKLALARAWEQARNILCVRLDTLGDVLMTTPAIRAVRESGRGRRITLLTSRLGEPIARLVPEIDDVIVYDAPWMKATETRSDSAEDAEMIKDVRRRDFDAAIIFAVYSQSPLPSALFCYLANIPLRLAYSRENPYQLLTNWVVEREPEELFRHEVQRQLDLVATVGAVTGNQRLSLAVSDRASSKALSVLSSVGLDMYSPWLVIHPGASAASRRYPPHMFAEVADGVAGTLGFQVVFTGSAGEKELVETVRAAMKGKSFSVAGRLDLEELGGLLRHAPLLIANNTGPVHMAAALQTPVVDLYALTNPQHTPWEVENRVLSHDVPCKNCYKSVCPEGHHHCLTLIGPKEVVEAAAELVETKVGGVASWR